MDITEMREGAARYAVQAEIDRQAELSRGEEAQHGIFQGALERFGVKDALEVIRDIWREGSVTSHVGNNTEGFTLKSDPFPYLTFYHNERTIPRISLGERIITLEVVAAIDKPMSGEKIPVIRVHESPSAGIEPYYNRFSTVRAELSGSIDAIPAMMDRIYGRKTKKVTKFNALEPTEVDRFYALLLGNANNRQEFGYLPEDIRRRSESVIEQLSPRLKTYGSVSVFGMWRDVEKRKPAHRRRP